MPEPQPSRRWMPSRATRRYENDAKLKPARSQAEITRVRQGWAMIFLAAINLAGTAYLVIDRI